MWNIFICYFMLIDFSIIDAHQESFNGARYTKGYIPILAFPIEFGYSFVIVNTYGINPV